MAKNLPPSGRSKVRIFFVDADLAPGDMQELTSALSSAIRPTHVLQRVAQPKLVAGSGDGVNGNGAIEDVEVEDVSDAIEEDPVPVEARGPSKPRKYRSPKPVATLNMTAGGKAFEDFAREMGSPTEHQSRYLVAAQWLAEFAQIRTATVDHIFTCYKSADWIFNVKDPSFPFRKLKKDGLGDTKDGQFTINHLGTAKVQKMCAVPV